jgi:hypothetical protein
MYLHAADLEPQPGEFKRRPGYLLHAEHVDIESAGGLQIGTNERHVVERIHANAGLLRHGVIIA